MRIFTQSNPYDIQKAKNHVNISNVKSLISYNVSTCLKLAINLKLIDVNEFIISLRFYLELRMKSH